MSLKPLKTIRYPDRVALEYEIVEPLLPDGAQPHHPQTFPAMASDDTCTWDNLRLLCEVGHTTDEDCVAVAWALLRRMVAAPIPLGADMAIAREIFPVEPEA